MKKDSNISGILAETEKIKDANIELEASLKKLQETQEKMASGSDKFSRAYQDNAVSLRKIEAALKSNNEQIDKNIKMLDMGKSSLEKNKALLESLKDQYAALTSSQGDNATGASKLNSQIAQLGKTVEDQEEKLTKSREVFDAHKESVEALKSASEKLKTANADFGPILQSATDGFNAMKTGLSAVKTGFNSVGGAIKTTGFGLLVLVLQSLVEYFTQNSEGIKKFKALIAGAGIIINGFKDGLASLRKILVDAFEHPADSIKKLGTLLLENIVNRFKAVLVIWDGVKNFDFKKISNGVLQAATGVTNLADKTVDAYKNSIKASEDAEKVNKDNHQKEKQRHAERKQMHKDEPIKAIARISEAVFKEYAKEINDTEAHFTALEKKYKNSAEKLINIEKEKTVAFDAIRKKFRAEDEAKLADYQHQLTQLAIDNLADVKQKAVEQLALDTKDKTDAIDAENKKVADKIAGQQAVIIELKKKHKLEEIKILEDAIAKEQQILTVSDKIRTTIIEGQKKKENEILTQAADVPIKSEAQINSSENSDAKTDPATDPTIKQQLASLKLQHDIKISNTKLTELEIYNIEAEYAKKKAELEDKLISSKIHAGDKYIDAVLKNSKKDSAIYKAAFLAKKATSIADVIISTKKGIIGSFEGYAHMPFIGQALAIAQAAIIAGQGAASIAEIAKQKPGFAAGGQYMSDGRGALLPGYSRTDNTNAYLRSGEAVVVSEAMRNPWARNLVSAINVAHGGRDFSIPNTGRGYAIGGIFTDGGNANRYYNQPVNDVKDLANTLAYQMINNFPPIYVDVKDVNNQQNILAQTVNRVNL